MMPYARREKTTVVAAMIAMLAPFAMMVFAQDAQQDSLPNPYRPGENWGQLPDGRKFGQTGAVCVDPKGHIWAVDRCGGSTCADKTVDPILEFESSGKLLKSFGGGMFVGPHGIYCAKDGSVSLTDNQGNEGKGQQVFKFSADGKVLLTLGKAGVAGDGPDTFNQPSAVVVAPNGDIFVADGHGGDSNARIVKFSKDGKFITAWGKKGAGPGEFDTPHAMAMDSSGRLFVADRGNNRIQIFDQDGKFLAEWKQFGRPSGLFIDENDILYSADSRLKKGITIGNAKDGTVTAFIPDVFGSQEGVAADREGNVYGALVAGQALKKYVKR